MIFLYVNAPIAISTYFQTDLKIASCGYQGEINGKRWQDTSDWSIFEGNHGGLHFGPW